MSEIEELKKHPMTGKTKEGFKLETLNQRKKDESSLGCIIFSIILIYIILCFVDGLSRIKF
jgi:hypothetical protein